MIAACVRAHPQGAVATLALSCLGYFDVAANANECRREIASERRPPIVLYLGAPEEHLVQDHVRAQPDELDDCRPPAPLVFEPLLCMKKAKTLVNRRPRPGASSDG